MGSLMQEFRMGVPYRSLFARPTASSAILYQDIVDIFLASGLENGQIPTCGIQRGEGAPTKSCRDNSRGR